MHNDYNLVKSLTPEEFEALSESDLRNSAEYTEADAKEIERIERLLDVNPGTLSGEPLYLEKKVCLHCGRLLTMYDFVLTALVDEGHTKSFILHTLIGDKYVVNDTKIVRCSACGVKTYRVCSYHMKRYRSRPEEPQPLPGPGDEEPPLEPIPKPKPRPKPRPKPKPKPKPKVRVSR